MQRYFVTFSEDDLKVVEQDIEQKLIDQHKNFFTDMEDSIILVSCIYTPDDTTSFVTVAELC